MTTPNPASSTNYWLRSGMYTLLERVSQSTFGVWVGFLTLTSILEVGRSGLLQNALIKYLANAHPSETPVINTASLVLNFGITLVGAVVLAAVGPWLSNSWDSPGLDRLFLIYIFTTFALIPLFQCNFIQQAHLEFKGLFWSTFVRQGLLFGFILYCYLAGKSLDLISLAWVQFIATVCGAATTFMIARPFLDFAKKIDWKWVKTLLHYGKFVFGTNLSTMLYKSIDKMMLLSMVSTAGAGLYEVAIRVTNLAEAPTFSIASILFPQSARRIQSEGKEGIRKLYEQSVGAILAILLPFILFVLIFPDWIVGIVGGAEYNGAGALLQLTMLYGLFIPFAVQFGTILDSIGLPKINFYFTMAGMGLNIVFNYLFIKQFGTVGAAYGTLTTYCITFIGMQWLLHKQLGVRALQVIPGIFQFYRKMFHLGRNYLQMKWSPEAQASQTLDK